MTQNQQESGFNLSQLGVDLSDPSQAQQAANVAGLAAGFVPGGPVVQNAGMLAAGVLGDSYEEAISWKLMKQRYGDLILLEMGEMPPADRPGLMARLDQIGDDRLRAVVESNPNLAGLFSELKFVDETLSNSPANHAAGLAGGLVGGALGGGFGMVGMLGGSVAGAMGAQTLLDTMRSKAKPTSTVRMYEQLIPAMQQPVSEGGGVDAGMVYAMLVARSHNPEFIKRIEGELKRLMSDDNATVASALEQHLQMRGEGKGEDSALSRLAVNDFDNVDFAASCGCSTEQYDLTKPIAEQLVARINHGVVDPRVLVMGDLPSLVLRRNDPFQSLAMGGVMPASLADLNSAAHGLPMSVVPGSLAV